MQVKNYFIQVCYCLLMMVSLFIFLTFGKLKLWTHSVNSNKTRLQYVIPIYTGILQKLWKRVSNKRHSVAHWIWLLNWSVLSHGLIEGKKLYAHCLVLIGSRNGFECDVHTQNCLFQIQTKIIKYKLTKENM